MNIIKNHFKKRQQRQNEALKEFDHLYKMGRSGDIIVPNDILTRFAKCRTAKQVESLNLIIKKINQM